MPATAIAHPNVALVKYWGKRDADLNLPAVGSLSITLGALRTETTVDFDADIEADRLVLNGEEAHGESARLTACLDALRARAGDARRAVVHSVNDFPTGAGLASSASGYAALVTAAAAALGLPPEDPALPGIARIGSGSAPRSLFGGFVVLRNAGQDTECVQLLPADSWPLEVVVAVATDRPKAVSSREGMELTRATSPYYSAWIDSHGTDLARAEQAVADRDFFSLAEVAEHSCLKMHGLMLSSRPPLRYWSPATIGCLDAIAALRADGNPVFFTIDAGPQVKAICLPGAAAEVAEALAAVPGVVRLIRGGLGDGARLANAQSRHSGPAPR